MAVVVPPLININRYHRLVADSISAAVGRPVRMADVKLVMLPRPGFELTDFAVEEDPAFGAEPLLRSATVRASIRLVSLWRGRLEIGRIRLEEPSLNLVRNRAGEWNVASIFIQAARIPNAPTAQKHAGSALRFPYIEASNARINLKLGDEKKPFSFVGADLSIWLAQPDEWQLRFQAQPVRTDLNLNLADTGLVQVRGGLHRAASLRQMPLDLTVDWSGASLGQLSRLLTGEDPGWRGTIDLRGALTGTPENALLKTQLRGTDIHRAEFQPDNTTEFGATCEVRYRYALQSIDSLACLAPVGDGQLLMTGAVRNIAENPLPALTLQIDRVPVAAIFKGLQLMRRNFPPGIRATGDVKGRFTFDKTLIVPFGGAASIDKVVFSADGLKEPLSFSRVTASVETDAALAPLPLTRKGVRRPRGTTSKASTAAAGVHGQRLTISSLSLAAFGDPPLHLDCTFSVSGFAVRLAGAGPMSRIIALNDTFRVLPLPPGSLAPQGAAEIDLTVHGPWLLPIAPGPADENVSAAVPDRAGMLIETAGIDGTLRLRNAQLTTPFLATPLEIVSASGVFSGNKVRWQPVSIDYGPLHAEGAVTARIPCPKDGDCARRFELHVDSLDIATLQAGLLGARRGQLVEEILSRITERPRLWPRMEGTLHVDTLSLNNKAAIPLTFHNATAQVETEGKVLSLQSLTAKTLDGDLRATGTIDASGDLPSYSLRLDVRNADTTQAAALFGERWGPGKIKLNANLQLSGFTIAQLRESAAGTFHTEWTGRRPASGATDAPGGTANFSRFDSWTADGTIASTRLRLDRSFINPTAPRLQERGVKNNAPVGLDPSSPAEPGTASIPISGSITFGRELSLREGTGPDAIEIGGTLQRPVVSPPANARLRARPGPRTAAARSPNP